MKHTNKLLLTTGLIAGLLSCDDTRYATPNVTKPAGVYTGNFLFVNATPDAPPLSFFVNNEKIGTDLGSDGATAYSQAAYTQVTLTSPGFAGALTSNTNIRAKLVTSGDFGVLKTNDLIYRAGNTNVGIPHHQ